MKHFIFLTFTICFLSLNLFAQPPSYEWAKNMGGSNDDLGMSLAVDAAGNVYTTGRFIGAVDFDPDSLGNYNLTAAGMSDIFISKLNASGNFMWAKKMGGSNVEWAYSIALDVNGNVYTTGYFQGTADFDPDTGTYNLSSPGNYGIFISKLDPNGNFVWAKKIGGTGDDYGDYIIIDATGNVYVTGAFKNIVDFDPGPGTFSLSATGFTDAFIIKLDSNGNFIWAKDLGGASWDHGYSITVDVAKNVYTTGYFSDVADFDPGAGSFNLSSSGNYDIFISKLDSGGNFVWAKSIGNPGADWCNSITIDINGNVYTTGRFSGTVDFDPGAGIYNLTANGLSDVFVSKLDSGANFIWAKNMGGIIDDEGFSIAVDAMENVYTTGFYENTADFDPGTGTYNLNCSGSWDTFISKLDYNGNFIWAKNISGNNTEAGKSIIVDNFGSIYLTGYFRATVNFNPPASANLTSNGNYDIFVSKYSQSGLGINEYDFSNEYKVFPNPTNGHFTIQLHKQNADIAVKLFNVTGQIVFSDSNHSTNTLNVSFEDRAGIYFLEVRSREGQVKRYKIIKD